MSTMLIAGGAVLLLILMFAFTRKAAPAVEFADDEVYWEDDEYEAIAQNNQGIERVDTRFESGGYYRQEQVEDLLWAYGYSRDEVRAALESAYVTMYRDGLSAAFQWFYGGDDLWRCEEFDPNADTSDSDRWRRQPTDDERRRAVWR